MPRLQVRELAEAQGYTITDLQLEANRRTDGARVSYSTVYNLWHNKTQRPDLKVLSAVAKVLGVKPGDLIVREEGDKGAPVNMWSSI